MDKWDGLVSDGGVIGFNYKLVGRADQTTKGWICGEGGSKQTV